MKLTIIPSDTVVIVDGVALHDIDMAGIVSIHAPVRGATHAENANNQPKKFQSTRP